jgi:hypothetical protein
VIFHELLQPACYGRQHQVIYRIVVRVSAEEFLPDTFKFVEGILILVLLRSLSKSRAK